jgi:glutathione S-transferase
VRIRNVCLLKKHPKDPVPPILTPKSTQAAYEKAVIPLFEHLDRVEKHLSTTPGPYYFGDKITEADIRLYTTIVRFDVVYVQRMPPFLPYNPPSDPH